MWQLNFVAKECDCYRLWRGFERKSLEWCKFKASGDNSVPSLDREFPILRLDIYILIATLCPCVKRMNEYTISLLHDACVSFVRLVCNERDQFVAQESIRNVLSHQRSRHQIPGKNDDSLSMKHPSVNGSVFTEEDGMIWQPSPLLIGRASHYLKRPWQIKCNSWKAHCWIATEPFRQLSTIIWNVPLRCEGST